MPLPWQVFAECLLFSLASILFFLLLLLFKMKRYKWTSCCCCCCRVSSSVAASLEAAHGPVNIPSVHSCLSSSLVSCCVLSLWARLLLGFYVFVFLSLLSDIQHKASLSRAIFWLLFSLCVLFAWPRLWASSFFFLRPILWRVHNLSFTELLSCTMGRNIIKS